MATLSALRTDLVRAIADKNSRHLTTTDLNRIINQAQDQWALDTEALERSTAFATTRGVNYLSPPANFIRPKSLIYQEVWSVDPLEGGIHEFGRRWGWQGAFSGFPQKYVIYEGLIRLWPAPSATSATTTLSDALTATSTSAPVASLSPFRTNGTALIDSEIMEYFGQGTLALSNLRRGIGQTTAAAHSSGATVTVGDVRMQYFARPTALSADTDSSEVPDRYTHIVIMWAAYQAMLFGQEKSLASEFLTMYRLEIERMVAIARQKSRQASEKVVSIDERGTIFL